MYALGLTILLCLKLVWVLEQNLTYVILSPFFTWTIIAVASNIDQLHTGTTEALTTEVIHSLGDSKPVVSSQDPVHHNKSKNTNNLQHTKYKNVHGTSRRCRQFASFINHCESSWNTHAPVRTCFESLQHVAGGRTDGTDLISVFYTLLDPETLTKWTRRDLLVASKVNCEKFRPERLVWYVLVVGASMKVLLRFLLGVLSSCIRF